MNDVVLFLQAMGEPEMAERVLAEHNRLEAFSGGLEKDCIDSAFKAGAASRDAEIAELVAALEAVIPEVAGGNAGLIAYNKCKAALAKVRKP